MWTIIILIMLSPIILISGMASLVILFNMLNWAVTTFGEFIYDICNFGDKK